MTVRLSFFVLNVEGVSSILRNAGFSVRNSGEAISGEIAFFPVEEEKGFCLAAHKFLKEEIPPEVQNTPFLVKVGKLWTEKGLRDVLKGYAVFKVPCLENFSDRQIMQVCDRCLRLPWGNAPQGHNGKHLLIHWLKRANQCFPRDLNEEMKSLLTLRKMLFY